MRTGSLLALSTILLLPAQATTAIRPFPISVAPCYQGSPALSGEMVAWLDARNVKGNGPIPHGDVYARDLRTASEVRITHQPSAITDLPASEGLSGRIALSDRAIIWVDCRSCRAANGLGGPTGSAEYVRLLPHGRDFRLPGIGSAVSHTTVVWLDSSGRRTIYGRDLLRRKTVVVATGRHAKSAPAIWGHTVVWMELRGNWDIRGKDLQTGRTFLVAKHRGTEYMTSPAISGSTVIWTRQGLHDGSVVIEGKSLATGKRFTIARLPAGTFIPWTGPTTAVSGSIVVWDQAQRGMHNFDVWGKDLAMGRSFAIAAGPSDEMHPAVDGTLVVWQQVQTDRRTGKLTSSDIYGARLP